MSGAGREQESLCGREEGQSGEGGLGAGRTFMGLLMPGWLEIILEKMWPLNCFELVIISIK